MGGGVTQVAGEHPVFDANGQFVVDSANERLAGYRPSNVRLQNSFLEARNLYLGGLLTGAYRITSWLSRLSVSNTFNTAVTSPSVRITAFNSLGAS